MNPLFEVYIALYEAERAMKTAMEQAYPSGSEIFWIGASATQKGVVVRHGYGSRIDVLNLRTGKTYPIEYYQIVPNGESMPLIHHQAYKLEFERKASESVIAEALGLPSV